MLSVKESIAATTVGVLKVWFAFSIATVFTAVPHTSTLRRSTFYKRVKGPESPSVSGPCNTCGIVKGYRQFRASVWSQLHMPQCNHRSTRIRSVLLRRGPQHGATLLTMYGQNWAGQPSPESEQPYFEVRIVKAFNYACIYPRAGPHIARRNSRTKACEWFFQRPQRARDSLRTRTQRTKIKRYPTGINSSDRAEETVISFRGRKQWIPYSESVQILTRLDAYIPRYSNGSLFGRPCEEANG